MPTASHIRTLLSEAWRASASEASFLIPGICVSLIALFESSYLFEIADHLPEKNTPTLSAGALIFFIVLLLSTTTLKTIAQSQLFIHIAAKLLKRSTLFSNRARFRGLIRYIAIEIFFTLPLLLATIPLALTLLSQSTLPATLFTLLSFGSWFLFGICFVLIFILKRLMLGYILLSPLTFHSAFRLSLQIFFRYPSFSIFFFFITNILLSLFTFLQKLVILQGAFLEKKYAWPPIEILSYSSLLLLGTFMAILFETLWISYFLLLTNKRPEKEPIRDPLILGKEITDIPPITSSDN